MTKPEQFLWVVQTMVLTNAVNVASAPATAKKHRAVISVTGPIGLASEALGASGLIPRDKSAVEAAHEFGYHMLANLREIEEKASGKASKAPSWFARR
jgi:hypothetical protein